MSDDEPVFMTVRCPLTGVPAKKVAYWMIVTERRWGGEIVPVAGAPLEEQLATNADNVRRLVAMAAAPRPESSFLPKALVAVEASIDSCVAVALSADQIEARMARRRPGAEPARDAHRPDR